MAAFFIAKSFHIRHIINFIYQNILINLVILNILQMKFKVIITFILYAFLSEANGQFKFPEKKLCEELKNRTLAIELLEGEYADSDANLKQIFTDNWKLTPIEFVNTAKIKEIIKSEDSKYIILNQYDNNKNHTYIDNTPSNHSSQDMVLASNAQIANLPRYTFELSLPNKKNKQSITRICFVENYLSKADYLLLYQQLNRLIESSLAGKPLAEYYNVKRNLENINGNTLVLNIESIPIKDKEKIADNYKLKYEVIEGKVFEEIRLNKTPGKNYVKTIWSTEHPGYALAVFSAETGEVLAMVAHRDGGFIVVKHLKYITMEGAQNMISRYK